MALPQCPVCLEPGELCECVFVSNVLPMCPGALQCRQEWAVELLRHRLSRRVFLNILHFLQVMGPSHHVDCFLNESLSLLVLLLIWTVFQSESVSALSNWHAMVPSFVVQPLTHLFGLNLDIFSSIVNNVFEQYCCAPSDTFAWMAPFVDGFSVLDDCSMPLRGLCNPFFATSFICRMLRSVAARVCAVHSDVHAQPCVLIYVGPPLPRQFIDPVWAFHLGTPVPGTFPFHHPVRGMLPGYPYSLELWVLGDLSALVDVSILTTVSTIKHDWYRRYGIRWTPAVGPPVCRHPSGWPDPMTAMGAALSDAAQQYAHPLYSHGRLHVRELYHLHNELKHHALRCHHPAMLEARGKFGVQWHLDLLTPNVFSVYLVVCLRCHLLYVGSTTTTCWARYLHELRDARRHRHFYHRPSVLQRLTYRQHLCRCGLQWSLMGVLHHLPTSTPEPRLLHLEFAAMRRFNRDRLLNSRVPHGQPWTCPVSLTVVRQQMVSLLSPHSSPSVSRALQRMPLHQVVVKLLESRRVSVDPRELLRLFLQLLPSLGRSNNTVLMFQRFLLARLRAIRFWLPSNLCLRVHHLTPDMATRLTAVLKRHLRRLHVHPLVCQYYVATLSLVRCTTPSLGARLCNHTHCFDGTTYVDLMAAANMDPSVCACQRFSALCHPIHGHVLFRFLSSSQRI